MSDSASSKIAKRACTECRQQKARCDAHLKTPCSRCEKLNVHCVISSPFKREHKRKRLTELEHETAVLRQRLQSSSSPGSSAAAPTASSNTNSVYPRPASSIESTTQETFVPTVSNRTLGDVTLPAYEINELFYIYFKEYHPWLPILEPQVSPDEYFARLPFLFWAIIAVASRRYSRNPTLLTAVAERVLDEALLSLKSRSNYFFAVHGVLLMLTWPVTKNPVIAATGPLAGALVQMATQIGLHIPASAQDFARVKLHLSDADITKRAELWTFVTLIYQRVCRARGQQGALLEIQHTPQQVKALTTQLSASVKLQSKLEDITSSCDSAFATNVLPLMNSGNSSSLNTFLKVSESQIDDLVCDENSEIDRFYISAAKLYVGAYYLFEQSCNTGNRHHIVELFRRASFVIQQMEELDKKTSFLNNAPHIFITTAMLASFVLLRILKSSAAKFTFELGGEECLFGAIRLCKRLSLETSDVATRLITYITSLWNSSKAFRKADGSEQFGLRIKTRLAMSVVYDSAWWFKEEFDRIAMYDERLDRQHGGGPSKTEQDPDDAQSQSMLQQPMDPISYPGMTLAEWSAFDDPTLAEFAWALSDTSDFSFFPNTQFGGTGMVPSGVQNN